jgi:hypothetical protein
MNSQLRIWRSVDDRFLSCFWRLKHFSLRHWCSNTISRVSPWHSFSPFSNILGWLEPAPIYRVLSVDCGRKCGEGTNALAYFVTESTMKKKKVVYRWHLHVFVLIVTNLKLVIFNQNIVRFWVRSAQVKRPGACSSKSSGAHGYCLFTNEPFTF